MAQSIKGKSPTVLGEHRVEPDVRVAFLLSPDFTLLPFAGFIDAMRHSADEADRSRQIYCRWTCLSATLDPVRSSCGLEVLPWDTFGEPEEFDYVIIVGGLLSSFDQHFPETFEFLRLAASRDVSLIGLCTGSFAMAEAGLMNGKRCAVHIHHREELTTKYPEVIPVTNEMYVFDDGRITCPGGTAAVDLAVDVLSAHCGKSRGMKGLTALVVDEHRDAHHVGRLPYQDLEDCGDWRVERGVRLMRQSLTEPYPISRLAEIIGTSTRQLDRAFARHAKMRPQQVWREMRLQHARWRLVNTSRSISQVAFECGFADCAHFSRWFKRSFGETPHNYRSLRKVKARGPVQADAAL